MNTIKRNWNNLALEGFLLGIGVKDKTSQHIKKM